VLEKLAVVSDSLSGIILVRVRVRVFFNRLGLWLGIS
jgi:hypothetical protein